MIRPIVPWLDGLGFGRSCVCCMLVPPLGGQVSVDGSTLGGQVSIDGSTLVDQLSVD